MPITQQQYNVLQRRLRHLNIRIDILNISDNIVSSLEGIALDGNINISADSTHRRQGSLSMVITSNSNLIPRRDSRIWFNKRIQVSIGLYDYINDEIVWFNMGKFAIMEVDLNFDTSEKTINLKLHDYMAFLDGTLGGRLSNEILITPQNTPISQAIRAIVTSVNRFSIDEIVVNGSEAVVPYELNPQPNSTRYELIKELVELYVGYEFFFDEEGIFRVQKIKYGKDDPIIWNFNDSNMELVINYTNRFDFSNVKNSIYTWGRQLDNGTKIWWAYRNRFVRNTTTQRNAISSKSIGDICFVRNNNQSFYWDGSNWQLLDFNTIPDFCIEEIGENVWAYNDDRIYTVNQAMLRSEFELKEYSNFAEEIGFSCVPIYLLDVNRVVFLREDDIGINGRYLIKDISIPMKIDGTMSVKALKLYE